MQRFRIKLIAWLLALWFIGHALIDLIPISTADADGHGPDADAPEWGRAVQRERERHAELFNAMLVSVAIFGCVYPVLRGNMAVSTTDSGMAIRALSEKGARIEHDDDNGMPFISVDLTGNWIGKDDDFRLLEKLENPRELYLGKNMRGALPIINKLSTLEFVEVTDARLSLDDIQSLERSLPKARIYDARRSPNLIQIENDAQ